MAFYDETLLYLPMHRVFLCFGPIMLNKILRIIAVTEPQTIPFDVKIETLVGRASKIPGTTDTPTPKLTAIAKNHGVFR